MSHQPKYSQEDFPFLKQCFREEWPLSDTDRAEITTAMVAIAKDKGARNQDRVQAAVFCLQTDAHKLKAAQILINAKDALTREKALGLDWDAMVDEATLEVVDLEQNKILELTNVPRKIA
jgi:hypothetical protein